MPRNAKLPIDPDRPGDRRGGASIKGWKYGCCYVALGVCLSLLAILGALYLLLLLSFGGAAGSPQEGVGAALAVNIFVRGIQFAATILFVAAIPLFFAVTIMRSTAANRAAEAERPESVPGDRQPPSRRTRR